MKRAVFSIILVALVLAPIGIAEVVLRGLGLGDPVVYQAHQAYGFALAPDQRRERFDGAFVTVNASGLRSLDDWRGDGRHKVLFLGDSVTYGGSYVDDTDLFSHLACEIWKRNFQALVCGNAGVNAYGVLNMVLRSRYDRRLADADTVIFVFVSGDFLRGISRPTVGPYFLRENDWPLPALAEAINYAAYRVDLRGRITVGDAVSDLERGTGGADGAVEFAVEALRAEVARLREAGKAVHLFLSPKRADPSFESPGARRVIEAARAVGLTLTPIAGVLSRARGDYDDGIHYSKSGHAAVGDFLAEHVMPTAGGG